MLTKRLNEGVRLMSRKILAWLVALSLAFLNIRAVRSEESRPERTPSKQATISKPFRLAYTTEQLKEKFSDDQMRRAEKELAAIDAVNAKGPWKADWASLDRHPLPQWFRDAKFGIAINWGLYSVPCWDEDRSKQTGKAARQYPDAYPDWMHRRPAHIQHQADTFGPRSNYDDFFGDFSTQNYKPEELAALVADVGARYILPFCKHHDGVAWWDSKWTRRNFVQMGPKQDLLTPLVEAARKRNLKIAVYDCLGEYANVTLADDGRLLLRDWSNMKKRIPLGDDNRYRVSGCIPVKNYWTQYMTPLTKEMIDLFDPDILWLDGYWAGSAEVMRSRELAAYLYNRAEGCKEVCVNDRLCRGSRLEARADSPHGDFMTSESHTHASLTKYWEEIRSISPSYAFNQNDDEANSLTRAGLVRLLIDTVSNNGNLLLILGPDRTGRIPDLQLDRLQALGRWLKINGEAIYGTRVLPPYAEGTVAYTRSKDGKCAYAICKVWPGKTLKLTAVRAAPDAVVKMLGVEEPLAWKQDEHGLTIALPQKLQDYFYRPCEHAWAIRIPCGDKNRN
jgi:alpha-L-fucosidase